MTLPQFMRDLKAEVMSMLMQGLSTAKVGGASSNLFPDEANKRKGIICPSTRWLLT